MDFIAAIFELTGVWMIGNKNRAGFLLALMCNIAWIIVAIKTSLWGLLITMAAFIFINIRNYRKWGKDGH